uniref:Spermidine/putrescine transport system permease protein n=1 Tax=Candidatus Kentrum sp. DK TaxID=2126562 RepID=A0A450S3E4_9GAMM|nr:MAG: spermidine/putrescine transport system permease protein [Candidatus Kentron sp. DK]
MMGRSLQYLSLSMVGVLILAPVILVVIFAFNDVDRGMIWQGFSSRWVVDIFRDPESMRALTNSFIVACMVTAGAWIFGTSLAFSLGALGPRAGVLAGIIMLAPILTPDLPLAIAQSRFLLEMGGNPSVVSIALGELPYASAYMAILVLAVMYTRKVELIIHAALDLGATPFQTFRTVFIPITRPGWIAGCGIVFALSFQDFIFSFYLGGAGSSTLAVRIYSMLRKGLSPGINMLFVLMLIVVVLTLFIFNRTEIKREEEL